MSIQRTTYHPIQIVFSEDFIVAADFGMLIWIAFVDLQDNGPRVKAYQIDSNQAL